MRKAIMKISPHFLIEALRLPADTRILFAGKHYDDGDGPISFVVLHPDLPDVLPGEENPEISPLFHKLYDENGLDVTMMSYWDSSLKIPMSDSQKLIEELKAKLDAVFWLKDEEKKADRE